MTPLYSLNIQNRTKQKTKGSSKQSSGDFKRTFAVGLEYKKLRNLVISVYGVVVCLNSSQITRERNGGIRNR